MASESGADKSDEYLSVDEIVAEQEKPVAEPKQDEPSSRYADRSREELVEILEQTQSMVGRQSQEVKR